MSSSPPTCLYKEIRVDLESCVQDASVNLRVPSTSSWSTSRGTKRALPSNNSGALDETEYRKRHLASTGSIYHRQNHNAPKSFLWRVVENDKVLAIKVVDLSKQDKAADTYLTLRFHFPHAINPGCVAFADSANHDTLNAFVLSETNHLFTLTLRPEYFTKRNTIDDNNADWCKTFSPIGLTSKRPFRIVALDSRQILVTLHDCGFLKLTKRPGSQGSAWDEDHYNEGGWFFARALVPFQGNTIVYDERSKAHMELSALTSITTPALKIDDVQYVFSVSLGHRLKIWNLSTRQIAYDQDLLGVERTPNELVPYILPYTQSNFVKVVQDIGGLTVVVTFSPAGLGQFKFLKIVRNGSSLDLEDIDENFEFRPPPPTTDIWTLSDFVILPDNQASGVLSLWVLWKNNLSYRLQKVSLSMSSPADARSAWNGEWITVANETFGAADLPVYLQGDAQAITSKWMEYILLPNRFTPSTLETALFMYGQGTAIARKGTSSFARSNLAERIRQVVGSTTKLDRDMDDDDNSAHARSVDAQFRRFFRLVVELDRQRGEALSLSVDSEQELVTVVVADGIVVIRDCNAMERIRHNLEVPLPDTSQQLNTLVAAAASFSDAFSDELLQACRSMLKVEVFQEPSSADAARLLAYYDKCGFAGQISDDDYAQLLLDLGGSFKVMTPEVYDGFFHALVAAEDSDDKLEQQPFAEMGMKAIVKATQEMIELHQKVCFDQLLLLTFIHGEIDQEEEGIQIDVGSIFSRLLQVLWRLEFLSWLCKTRITLPLSRTGRTNGIEAVSIFVGKQVEETKTIPVLTGSLAHLLGLITNTDLPTPYLLTELVVKLCHPDSEYILQPALIQCFLLTIGRADLAGDFMSFCEQDPFSVYIRGRVYLELKDYTNAAAYFKKAAFGMAHTSSTLQSSRNSSGLLNDSEWALLYNGLPKYYSHITALFEAQKSHNFIVDFSRLALQYCQPTPHDSTDTFDLLTDLQSRLFNAALTTHQFSLAYTTITQMSDAAIQHASLRSLVFRMCESKATTQLLNFPFVNLMDTIETILLTKCRSLSDVTLEIPYHQILYALRIKHNDFRGAASIAYERLEALKHTLEKNSNMIEEGQDELETAITRQHLMLINALSCVGEKEAWVLADMPALYGSKGKGGKRKVVRLEDARRAYQGELDRIAAVANGQYAFCGGDVDML